MRIHDNIQQHSSEWHNIRKGKITGSVLKDLISPKTFKVSDSKTAESVLLKIIASKYIIQDSEDIQTFDMVRGIENEARARELYSKNTLTLVNEVGFIESDCGFYGMSPDGLIGNDGFIEIKCPRQAKHLNGKLTNGQSLLYDDGYILQIMMGFVLHDNLKYCDLISYNEDFVLEHRLFIFRIHRDEEQVQKVKEAITILIEKMNTIEKSLKLDFDLLIDRLLEKDAKIYEKLANL